MCPETERQENRHVKKKYRDKSKSKYERTSG